MALQYSLWLISLNLLLQFSQGDYEVHVLVNSYRNDGHLHSRGCCHQYIIIFGLLICQGDCDNYFLFCLRPFQFSSLDKSCPSAEIRTEEKEGDNVTFGDFIGGRPNPVILEVEGQWEGSFQLRIDIHDDSTGGPFVDEVFAEPLSFPLGGSFSDPTRYAGVARLSTIELSFRVRCKDNFYGSDCDTYCLSNERYSCNEEGNRVCRPGYFVLPECSIHCVPETDRFRCDPESGEKTCIQSYYTPSCDVYCVPHPTNFTCDPVNGTYVCRENYFTEECDVFCEESSDLVDGFYTCDPITGEKLCMDGYVDPDTDCITQNVSYVFGGGTTESDSKKEGNVGTVTFVLVLVTAVLVFTMLTSTLLACRLTSLGKRKGLSRNLTQTLQETSPRRAIEATTAGTHENSYTLHNDSMSTCAAYIRSATGESRESALESSQERNFLNPLYRQKHSPYAVDVDDDTNTCPLPRLGEESEGLYCSVRSAVRVNIAHLSLNDNYMFD